MAWANLRTEIVTKLQGISQIQEVANYPKLEFNGYPAAYVVPSDNTSDYETTTENQRVYVFNVMLLVSTKNRGMSDSITAMEELIDSVINAFDQEEAPGATRTIGASLATGENMLGLMATPSAWEELPEQELLMAKVNVRVKISFDIT